MIPRIACVLVLATACAATDKSQTTLRADQVSTEVPTDARAEPAAPPSASPSPAPDPRALPAYPTFADLVDAARSLDEQAAGHGGAGCLLRGEQSFRFEADVLVGARPLPRALGTLAPTLEEAAGPVNVLSAWGSIAGETLDLVLVAFTTTTLEGHGRPALALFLTSKGTYVRGAAPQARSHPEALGTDALSALLASLPASAPPLVYVTAEASVSLSSLRALLMTIPASFEVALAVALPKGTRLPAAIAESRAGLCPEGLPELPEDAPEGDLPVEVLMAALAPLREAASACASSVTGRAVLGGRLSLALRIGLEGRIEQACVPRDELQDPTLRACLIASARELVFPPPAPAGSVDVELPLQLTLHGPRAQRALCD